MAEAIMRTDWIQMLQDFTDRNAGRYGHLETEDPEIGTHRAEVSFPLRGVAYDPRDGRVEIMFGDPDTPQLHLTRSLVSVRGIDLLTKTQRAREVLRVAQDSGQTLLHVL